MTATVTDKLKKNLVDELLVDFNEAGNYYYAAIGKSEIWNDSDLATTPSNSLREARNARLAIQSAKLIADASLVVPRYNWSTGTVYAAWDDNTDGQGSNAYYVMNSNQQVYVCVQQARTATNPSTAIVSTVEPSGNVNGTPFATADGYVWKFLFTVGSARAAKYMSAGYIPVTFVDSAAPGATADISEQATAEDNAVAGQVLSYVVTNSGSGYSSAPTVTIQGNGTNAKATATVAGGQVVKITVKDSSGTLMFGSGYDYANVVVSGGGGDSATARAVLAPVGGLGANPTNDLKAAAVMFNSKPEGAEGGDFFIGQDFRQVTLLKNITLVDSTGLFTSATGNALNRLVVGGVVDGPFTKDITIEGATSGAKAYVDYVDSDLFYHQNESTGFLTFDSGETISIVSGGGATTATVVNTIKGEFDPMSGELLYIDNRAAVTRATDQTEDIKIVIQL